MSKTTTAEVKSISIYRINGWGGIPDDGFVAYNRRIVWSIDGEETGSIYYDMNMEEPPYMRLHYKTKPYWASDEEYISIDYQVPLEFVPCLYGGKRWYFRCPISRNNLYCGRRVGVLYKSGNYFMCRYCADLTYESCNEIKKYRSLGRIFEDERRAEKLWGKIGRTHYAGKPTRKYRRYMELMGHDIDGAYKMLDSMLGRG